MNTLYDTIKSYGKGKGEDMMWKSVAVISDAIEKGFSEEQKEELTSDIYGLMSNGHYNEAYAHGCVAKLFYVDKDGKRHYGPYWTDEQIRPFYEAVKVRIQEYNFWDYYVVFNMMAADNWNLYHGWWPEITGEQFAQKIADSSLNWLTDVDWPTKSKIWDYMHIASRSK